MSNKPISPIAKRLRFHRERAGLTQEQVAAKLNIRQSTCARWELGERNPSDDTLLQLKDILGCSYNALYHGEENEYLENLTTNVICAAMGDPNGIYSFLDDLHRDTDRVSETINAFFDKWAGMLETAQPKFYDAVLREPQWEDVTALRWSTLKAEHELYQSHEHIQEELDSISYAVENLSITRPGISEIVREIGTDDVYRLTFCIAVNRLLRATVDPDDLMVDAWSARVGDDTRFSLSSATVLFASEVFVPYCHYVINALKIIDSGGVDQENFESAFLFQM